MGELPEATKSMLRECRRHVHAATDRISEVLTRPDGAEVPGRMEFIYRELSAAGEYATSAMRTYCDHVRRSATS